MRKLAALGAVLVLCAQARADARDGKNVLIGPVLGLRLGGPPGDPLILGVEGGFGKGPERLNLGFTRRLDHQLYYLEVDPWFIIGASFGWGIDSNGEGHGIIGLWEGWPIAGDVPCAGEDWYRIATLAGGYRYTGVHELYITVKAGMTESWGCLD
jgi:hypothetical protein